MYIEDRQNNFSDGLLVPAPGSKNAEDTRTHRGQKRKEKEKTKDQS
jgi:hypothetical protein